MKMPSKGTAVAIENGGFPLFVGGIDLDDPDEAEVMLKYEGGDLDDGYGRGIVTISLDEFEDRRVYTEQLPNDTDLGEIIQPNELRPEGKNE